MTGVVLWARGRGEVGNPVYVYLYDHPYPGANNGPIFGAFHTAEVPYVFGTLGLGPRKFTDMDRTVARQLQDHWLAFMRTGDPSLPSMPWKPVSKDSGTEVMGLGKTYGPRPAFDPAAL
jgi:para-nitrobenzyl esterase